MCAHESAAQAELFKAGWEDQTDALCTTCATALIRTTSGYLCCPNGHGKLLVEQEPEGAAFPDQPYEPEQQPDPWYGN
jgi:uncharacterized Zn finger protein (UPF0148 family)